jgi:hypothetical protein
LPEARIGRRVEGPLDGLGDGLFVQVGRHCLASL